MPFVNLFAVQSVHWIFIADCVIFIKIIPKPNVDDLSVNDTIFLTRRVFVVVMELRNVRGWDDYVTAILINCKQM